MNKITLIGDSVFDNSSYVRDGQSVKEILSIKLKEKDLVDLLAVDGSITRQVVKQLDQIQEDTTHIFVSSGGNDALSLRHLLQRHNNENDSDLILPHIVIDLNNFQSHYSELADQLQGFAMSVTLCTIYDKIPGLTEKEVIALRLFNSIIIETAIRYQFSILDLRAVCTATEDYSSNSPIEPSETGGKKIAHSIAQIVYGTSDLSAIKLYF
jgi:hypothetical protein